MCMGKVVTKEKTKKIIWNKKTLGLLSFFFFLLSVVLYLIGAAAVAPGITIFLFVLTDPFLPIIADNVGFIIPLWGASAFFYIVFFVLINMYVSLLEKKKVKIILFTLVNVFLIIRTLTYVFYFSLVPILLKTGFSNLSPSQNETLIILGAITFVLEFLSFFTTVFFAGFFVFKAASKTFQFLKKRL